MSTELVVGIGSRESPDHMTSPTTQWLGRHSRHEDYYLKVRVTKSSPGALAIRWNDSLGPERLRVKDTIDHLPFRPERSLRIVLQPVAQPEHLPTCPSVHGRAGYFQMLLNRFLSPTG